jgi:peptidoglycan/xylan/chitin deacetylase (PgdA/CDA1 family)
MFSTVVCTLHHHVGRESAFERGLDVSTEPDAYEAQIDWMGRHFDFIDLDTLLSGRLPRHPLLLTFDDTFGSVLDVVRAVLAPRGIPSVYFINAGLLGRQAISLDSALAWAASKGGVEAVCDAIGVPRHATIAELIQKEMAALSANERANVKSKVLAAFGPPDFSDRAPLLEAADLEELPRLGVEVGNHTMTHVHCRALDTGEIEEEVIAAKARLEELSHARVRSFSVPYGHERDLTPELLAALRASGHEAIFLVHARPNRRRPAPDVWYRTSLHNEAPKELAMHLRYLPAARSMKQLLFG